MNKAINHIKNTSPAVLASALFMMITPQGVQACSYSESSYSSYSGYTYHNYNVCDGSYCSADLYCENYNCVNNTCKGRLQAWAIFLITFFSVFIFLSLIRLVIVCCRRKRAAIIIRE